MRCSEEDPIPGIREVKWRVLYRDDDLAQCFITECSARIAFPGRGYKARVLDSSLDETSRKTRNSDCNDYMKDKRTSSTGLRRPHVERDES
jgi:hypothetical protein